LARQLAAKAIVAAGQDTTQVQSGTAVVVERLEDAV
jgi:hypothetical protein